MIPDKFSVCDQNLPTWLRRIAAWLCLPLLVFRSSASAADDIAKSFQTAVRPILNSHCGNCHGTSDPAGRVDLSTERATDRLLGEFDLWFRVATQLDFGLMPPEGETPLSPAERQAVRSWIQSDFAEAVVAHRQKVGRTTLRRLSRSEYANTVEDLLGIRPTVVRNLPDDGRVFGYDKVSAALPLSNDAALGYVTMADAVLNRLLQPAPSKPNDAAAPDPAGNVIQAIPEESGESPGHSLRLDDGTIVSFNSDTTSGRLRFTTRRPGRHRIRITAYAYQSSQPITVGLYAGKVIAYPQVLDLLKVLEFPAGQPGTVETDVYLHTGDLSDRETVSDGIRLIPFGLGVQVPKNSLAKNCRGPGLAIQKVEVIEPLDPLPGDRWLSRDLSETTLDLIRRGRPLPSNKELNDKQALFRGRILTEIEATLARVGARFYRRPLAADELSALMTIATQTLDQGARIRNALLDPVAAMMTSPDFLCRIERPGQLNDFELASRLSYFLWNSGPDEQLLAQARLGRLSDPRILQAEADRLLSDSKADRFVNDFTDQWLGLRMIDDTRPDAVLYPEYAADDLLKISSQQAARRFFRQMLDDDLPVSFVVDSPWAFVNHSLARHYGLADRTGFALEKQNLPTDSPYGGLWTEPAVLKISANGTTTSPIKRGAWFSNRILGRPIPPPPPSISPIDPDIRGAKTIREQIALHSSQGSCIACHQQFDGYGLALESFDVTGRFRTHYRQPKNPGLLAAMSKSLTWQDGPSVAPSGQTPDGHSFADIRGLRALVRQRPEQLTRGLVTHLLTYATGAVVDGCDQPGLDRILQSTGENPGLRSLIHALIQSPEFTHK